MDVHTFTCGPLQTNAYLIVCPKTRTAAFIDPAPMSASALTGAAHDLGVQPDKILLTHSHWDHITDVATVKKRFPVPVLVHPADAPNLQEPGTDGLPLFLPCKGVMPDILLADQQEIEVGTLRFQVIHTPGHTPGGVCYYEPQAKILIAGDTLFQGSIGNLSLPTANPEAMWTSLDNLASLPADTTVYPGHGPATTIGAETWLPNARNVFGGY